jgi:hypothetical protein
MRSKYNKTARIEMSYIDVSDSRPCPVSGFGVLSWSSATRVLVAINTSNGIFPKLCYQYNKVKFEFM